MIITVNDIKYQLDKDNKTAIVIEYQGEPVEVIIPEFIEYKNAKYKVTEIDYSAFYGCQSLTSINIPNSVIEICADAFCGCIRLQSINIPNSVTKIGSWVFQYCEKLKSINIPDSVTSIGISAFEFVGFKLPKRYTNDGKLIGYKAFKSNMTCLDFQYEEGKSYEIEGKIKCCEKGFHACTNPLDVFNYYGGEIGKDVYVHEVYLSGTIDEDNKLDSKVCSSKIEIGKRLSMKDINSIINNK